MQPKEDLYVVAFHDGQLPICSMTDEWWKGDEPRTLAELEETYALENLIPALVVEA